MTTDGQVVQSIVENYDVYSTPEFYFLDEDKNLIYKKFDVEDLTKIVNQYTK
jgi:hypothetical protein